MLTHFTGPVKPWHRAFVDPYRARQELVDFLASTPWRTFIADANPPPRLVGIATVPNAPARQEPAWRGDVLAALVRYLARTPFADVQQGLTVLNPSALPVGV